MNRASSSLQTCVFRRKKILKLYFAILIPSIDIIQLIQIFVNRAPSSLQIYVFHREKMEKFDNFISQFLIFTNRAPSSFQSYVFR